MARRTPDGILAVRAAEGRVIADFDVTEKMLRYFLKTIIDKHVFRVKPRSSCACRPGSPRSSAGRSGTRPRRPAPSRC